jgi:hypothetical protein
MFFSVSERQEQDGRQADRRLLRPRRGGEDQEAGHQVPARVLSPKRSGEFDYYVVISHSPDCTLLKLNIKSFPCNSEGFNHGQT